MSQNAEQPETPRLCLIFVSEDQALSDEVKKQLQLLELRGFIILWSVQKILAGSEWQRELDAQLLTSDLIVYLLSTDFLLSDDYARLKQEDVLERYRQGNVQLIPVLLRPVDLDESELLLTLRQLLPDGKRPVNQWDNRDSAMHAVFLGMKQIIKDLRAKRRSRSAGKATGTAGSLSAKILRNVPYRRNPLFTGREDVLTALNERLHVSSQTSALQVLSGLGGVGKTQIALEYIYRYGQAYQEIFWLRADTSENLAVDGLALAQTLRLSVRNDPDQARILAALRRWFELHHNWLLVMDNVTQLKRVTDFLPVQYQGHVLITTRSQVMKGIGQKLQITALENVEGVQLLLRRAGILEPDAETERKAYEIVQMLGGLPLALDQAGAYIEDMNTGLDNYIEFYQQKRSVLLNRRGSEESEHPASVVATFLLAFAQVEQEYPPAADLLRLCAFLHPDLIPEALLYSDATFLPGVRDRWDLNGVLETLLTFSLIRRQSETQTLSVHRLVQDVLKDALTEEQQRFWAEKAFLLVSRAWPEPVFANWAACQAYLPQALACVDLLNCWQFSLPETIHLLSSVGRYLTARAAYGDARRCLLQARVLSEAYLGSKDLLTASVWHDLGWLAHCQNAYAEADEYYQLALALRESKLGPEDVETARTLQKIGLLRLNQGEYEQAGPLLQRTLAIREQRLEANDPEVADTLNALARLARADGDYAEAEKRYLRALAINEQTSGTDAPATALIIVNLATLFLTQKKYSQAEQFYQRALAIREQALGSEHPDTALVLDGLATAYRLQEKYAEAEPLSRRALAIQEQVQGQDHLETAQSQMTLAMILYRQENYAEAEILCERVLVTYERFLKPHDTRLITNLSNLGLIYQARQKLEQARALFQRAYTLSSAAPGQDQSNTRRIQEHLNAVSRQMGLPVEKSNLDEQAFIAQDRKLPTEKDQAEQII